MVTLVKTRLHNQQRKAAVRSSLLALAESFGAKEEATQRQLAARFWRVLPRGVTADQAVRVLTKILTQWGEAVIGRPVRMAELRMAFMLSGANVNLLLLPEDKIGMLAMQLKAALPHAVPVEKPLAMPTQSLTPLSVPAFIASLFSAPSVRTVANPSA